MRVPRFLLLIVVVIATASVPAPAQSPTQAYACLHTGLEAPAQAARRREALAAVRMINRLLFRLPGQPRTPAYPTWEVLADSPRLSSLRGSSGAAGDLARKIVWGSEEPLPDWVIHYVAGENAYAFSLTDVSDPCRFTYSSDDTGVVVEGQPIRRPGIVPIT